jgi:ADP-heptose:LPS heptosyltransferase
VIRPGAIGDFIVSLPALERLRCGYLEVWVAPPNVPLVRFADRVRSIASTGLDLLGVAEPPTSLLDELRGFDSIVSWYGANRPEFRELMRDLKLPCIFFPALPTASPDAAAVHATDFYLEQVRELSAAGGDPIPRIRCQAASANFAALHPFSGSARKNWPLEKFRQMARGLERTMPVHWCAGPQDEPLDDAVRIHDLYELACCLASSRLYIGNDFGITHLAAAVGTPVLALFGPTDPSVWAPRGANVRVARWGV